MAVRAVELAHIRVQDIRERAVAIRTAHTAGLPQLAYGHAAGRAFALGAEQGGGGCRRAEHIVPQAAEAAAKERMERIAPEMVHGLERVFKRAAKVFFLRAFRTQVHLARDAVDSFLIRQMVASFLARIFRIS